jgi:hypothetical protein
MMPGIAPLLLADALLAAALHIRIIPDARSVAERVAQVDAVVVATVESARSEVIDADPQEAEFVRQYIPGFKIPDQQATGYRVRVVDSLKSFPSPTPPTSVVYLFNDGPDAPELRPGQTYLLFLAFDRRLQSLVISPFDVYPIGPSRIEPTRLSVLTAYGAEILNRSPSDAVAHVRGATASVQNRP